MRTRIEDVKGNIDALAMILGSFVVKNYDETLSRMKEVIFALKHPIATYMVYREEKGFRNCDQWEIRDYAVQQRRRYDFL